MSRDQVLPVSDLEGALHNGIVSSVIILNWDFQLLQNIIFHTHIVIHRQVSGIMREKICDVRIYVFG